MGLEHNVFVKENMDCPVIFLSYLSNVFVGQQAEINNRIGLLALSIIQEQCFGIVSWSGIFLSRCSFSSLIQHGYLERRSIADHIHSSRHFQTELLSASLSVVSHTLGSLA